MADRLTADIIADLRTRTGYERHLLMAEAADRLDGLSVAVTGAEQATADARRKADHLNGPMMARLRHCAADTSPGWDRAFTIYPSEARGLVALIDDVKAQPADVPAHDHPHHYLSTACWHGHHHECGRAQHQRGDLTAPHCKFCDQPCVCPKHLDPLAPCTGSDRKRRHHPTCATPDDDEHLGWCGPNMDTPAASEASRNVVVTACEICGETGHWCTCNAVDRGAA